MNTEPDSQSERVRPSEDQTAMAIPGFIRSAGGRESVSTEPVPLTRGAVGETVAEDQSFINIREVRDWCKEAREHKPPLVSSTTAFSLSVGLVIGFAPAYAATDVATNGVWKGIFLLGAIIGIGGVILSLLAMVMELPNVRKRLHRVARPTDLERLADRMHGACENGRLRAAAAERALQRELDERKEAGAAS